MTRGRSGGSRPAVVGVVLLRDDGAALLQHRDNIPTISDPGLWVFPGGHADEGESLLAAAIRELEEETCYVAVSLKLLVQFEARELGYPGDFDIAFFWDVYDGTQTVECREGQALEFVRREAAGDLPCRDYLADIWDFALRSAGALQV